MSSSTPRKVSRRDFLKITAIAGLSAGFGASLGRRWMEGDFFTTVSETHYLMGTVVNFSISTPDSLQSRNAIQATVAEMKRLVSIFDHRSPDNQLARLNRVGFISRPSSELQDILRKALAISALTQGAFDITVKPVVDAFRNKMDIRPELLGFVGYHNVIVSEKRIYFTKPGMAITLDGIAKGHIIDRGVAVLRALGFESVLVEAGGDLMAINDSRGKRDWRIGINHPRSIHSKDHMTTILVKNEAVATSGDYVNYFSSDLVQNHIIDPRSGRSPVEIASATIIAQNATEADALSTSTMVLGVRDGLALVERLSGVEGLFVTKDLSVHKSTGFPSN